MRKIVFAVPREEDPVIFTFAPLAVLGLAKQVKEAGFDPVIIDGKQVKDDFLPRMEKEFKDDPVLLWCSGKTGRQLKDLTDAAKLAKTINPDLPVVFGGWHAQMALESTLNTPYVDYVVRGQGEITLPLLAKALAEKSDARQIAGLAGKDEDGKIWIAPDRPWERNLDAFGPLPWEWIDMEFYVGGDNGRAQSMVVGTRRSINYTFSRGCHGMCTFCHITALWNRAWFSHTPEFALGELDRLVNEFKAEGIDFHDSNLFTGLPRTRTLVQGMIDRDFKVRWKASVRADQINRFPDDFMAQLKASGCAEFAIGAEGGSQRIMGLVAKEIVPSDVVECSRKLSGYGILPEFSFMVGFPDEKNWEDSKMTLAFMAKLRQLAPNSLAEYFYYTPFPGTPLFKDYAKTYMPVHDTLDDYVNFSTYTANMPWVDKKLDNLLDMASNFYFKFAIPSDKMKAQMNARGLKGLVLRTLGRLSNWRVRNLRYGWPIEFKLARFVKDVLINRFGLFTRLQEVF